MCSTTACTMKQEPATFTLDTETRDGQVLRRWPAPPHGRVPVRLGCLETLGPEVGHAVDEVVHAAPRRHDLRDDLAALLTRPHVDLVTRHAALRDEASRRQLLHLGEAGLQPQVEDGDTGAVAEEASNYRTSDGPRASSDHGNL